MSDQESTYQAWTLLGKASTPIVPEGFARQVRDAALRESDRSRVLSLPIFAAAAVLALSMALPMLVSPNTSEMDRLARIEAALNRLDALESLNGEGQAEALIFAQLDDPGRLSEDDFLALFY